MANARRPNSTRRGRTEDRHRAAALAETSPTLRRSPSPFRRGPGRAARHGRKARAAVSQTEGSVRCGSRTHPIPGLRLLTPAPRLAGELPPQRVRGNPRFIRALRKRSLFPEAVPPETKNPSRCSRRLGDFQFPAYSSGAGSPASSAPSGPMTENVTDSSTRVSAASVSGRVRVTGWPRMAVRARSSSRVIASRVFSSAM